MTIRKWWPQATLVLGFIFYHPITLASVGELSVESTSFFKNASDRKTTQGILRLGPRLDYRDDWVRAKLTADGYLDVEDPGKFTVEAPEAYIQLGEWSHGRKRVQWSQSDEAWRAGLWSPRFLWDPLRPEPIGLTGGFWERDHATWRATTFISVVRIPERGSPFMVENGKLRSQTPFWRPLPEQLQVVGGTSPTVDIQYELSNVATEDLFHPSAALKFEVGRKKGLWSSFGYGYLPVHQVSFAINGYLDASTAFLANIKPLVTHRHLVTVEGGLRKDAYSAWASVSGDFPERAKTDPRWLYQPPGNAVVSSFGGDAQIHPKLKLAASYFRVDEAPVEREGILDVALDLPNRFDYQQASRMDLVWKPNYWATYQARWIFDIDNLSHLYSTDFFYRFRNQWHLNLGIDAIASATREGWFGQFLGNDRVRGSVTYAF